MTRDRSSARRALLRRLIGEQVVTSQADAVRVLARHGHRVTQATVSRDLTAVGARKVAGAGGSERYAVDPHATGGDGASELSRMLCEFVVAVEHSGNLALLRTAPGSAGAVASALDTAPPRGVLGTVAGDDTVLVITRSVNGGATAARRFQKLLEGV